MAVTDEDIRRICAIGHDCSMRGSNLPLQQLLDERHYRQSRPAITVPDLSTHLEQNPEVVDQWWSYSSDKRTAGGWYLTMDGDEWIVGTRWWDDVPKRRFTSGADACATFILNELDFYSNLPKR